MDMPVSGMQLTSAKNPLLQSLRMASVSGRPTADGLIVAEGPHLLEEALRSQWRVAQVFITPAARERHAHILRRFDGEVVEVSPRAFTSTAGTETTQELITTLEPRTWTWNDLAKNPALIVALDGIGDPGNAGTIIRSAEAFGASGVVFLNGSVRVSNSKLIRATAGSIFRLPFLEQVAASDLIQKAAKVHLQLYALSPNGETSLLEANLREPCVLIAGSEGAGVSPGLLAASQTISIPTVKIDSLNAAVASSIALFEAGRQRDLS